MAWLVRSIIGLAATKIVRPQIEEAFRNTDFHGKLRETGRALHRDHQDSLDAKARIEAEIGRELSWDEFPAFLDASTDRYRYAGDLGQAVIPLADWIAGKR